MDCTDGSLSRTVSAKEKATLPRPKKKRHAHWATYLWPGLAHLWIRGSLAGLALALAFSVLLNVLILGTLVWPAWLELRLKFICASGVGLLWVAALWETRGELRRLEQQRLASENEGENSEQSEDVKLSVPDAKADDTLLSDAQKAYLIGDWVQAEQLYRKAIRADRRDVEARLGYATLLRRIGRLRQAKRRLDRLALLDAAQDWKYEIAKEHELIARQENQNLDDQQTATVAIEKDAPPLEQQELASEMHTFVEADADGSDGSIQITDTAPKTEDFTILPFNPTEQNQPKPPEAA